jgi:hypothetical protein
MAELHLRHDHLMTREGNATDLGQTLVDYFAFRAATINGHFQQNLMDAPEAAALYDATPKPASYEPPMNKQKGEKKQPSFLTALVELAVLSNSDGLPCDTDPRELTSITKDKMPVRTLARRVDGAFPAAINPIAIWEIKEYYYTTTFGSRIADGVYETLLDGLELEELLESEKIAVEHLLIMDSKYTWWGMGRSYLCRIVDMLHMGLVDEVIVGREVVTRIPVLTKSWVEKLRKKPAETPPDAVKTL